MAKFCRPPSLAILPQNCIRNDFTRPEIQNFLGDMPPDHRCGRALRAFFFTLRRATAAPQPPCPKTSSYAAVLDKLLYGKLSCTTEVSRGEIGTVANNIIHSGEL